MKLGYHKTSRICIMCKEFVLYHPNVYFEECEVLEEEKNIKGMVYSDMGVRELQISQLCERCFDEITQNTGSEDVWQENDGGDDVPF